MTPLFESMEDFANNGGAITDYEVICEMMNSKRQSLFDIIDGDPFEEDEYRDEREDSSRLADRHHC